MCINDNLAILFLSDVLMALILLIHEHQISSHLFMPFTFCPLYIWGTNISTFWLNLLLNILVFLWCDHQIVFSIPFSNSSLLVYRNVVGFICWFCICNFTRFVYCNNFWGGLTSIQFSWNRHFNTFPLIFLARISRDRVE